MRQKSPDTFDDLPGGIRAHPTALIAENAVIGEGTTIGPFCIVGTGAVIGAQGKLFAHAQVKAGAVIGNNCILGDGAKVLVAARIGNRCVIGENCTIYGEAVLGDGVKMECCSQVWPLVTLEDNVFVGPNATFTNDLTPRAAESKGGSANWVPTVVREGASLGANCTIVCGTTIGTYAVIAAGSVVARNVPSYTLAKGVPAKPAYEVCAKNHGAQKWARLTFADDPDIGSCPSCSRQYRRGSSGTLVLVDDVLI